MALPQHESLAQAADDNFVLHAAWLQRATPGMTVRDHEGIVLVDSGLRCEPFNIVCRSRLAERRARETVRRTLKYYRSIDRPFSWSLSPADSPADLGELLRREGLVPDSSELAMAADLATIPHEVLRLSGLKIERVVSRKQLADFAQINAANRTPAYENVASFYERVSAAVLRPDCPLQFFLGYVGGSPVATSEVSATGATAGLYNISTLAPHRRQGFGTAMAAWSILEAQSRGASVAVLQASHAGISIYRRLGFIAYGEINEYRPIM